MSGPLPSRPEDESLRQTLATLARHPEVRSAIQRSLAAAESAVEAPEPARRAPVATAPAAAPVLVEPPLDDRQVLAVESYRRRQVLNAFLHGSRPPAGTPSSLRGLLYGAGLAVAIAAGTAIAVMIQGALQHP